MKKLIKNILKEEEEENNLEERFKNSMKKLQYIFESNVSSKIDSIEINKINFIPKYPYIEGKLIVKSYYEDHDFGGIAKHIDKLEDEVYKIQGQYTFTEKGRLIKRGPDNDWFMSCMPIAMKWNSYGDEPFMITLEFLLFQDDFDA